MCAYVRDCMCVRACARARVCVRVCLRACVCVCVCGGRRAAGGGRRAAGGGRRAAGGGRRAAGGGRRAAGGGRPLRRCQTGIDLNITVMPGWRSWHGERVVRRQSAVQLPGRLVTAVFPSRFVAGAVRHQHYGAGHADPHRSLHAQRRRCLHATQDRHEEYAARRGETARQRAYDSSRTTPPSSVKSPCSRERAACPATASASNG